MTNQHPTAIISPKAKLGENVTVEPFAIIHDDVEIGDNTHIGPHVVVYDGARIGKSVRIYQGASIAHVPQDLKFANEETYLYIGDNTTVHECVTLHKGTKDTRQTRIGKNVLLMAYSHVAHDCYVGDNCILANAVQLAGHVHVDEWAIIGGGTPAHQFTRIGKHCMIGGGYRIPQDVPPFILAAGEPLKYSGLNSIGLRRRGFNLRQIETLKDVYATIYSPHYNVSQALNIIREKYSDDALVQEVVDFVSSSKRGITGK